MTYHHLSVLVHRQAEKYGDKVALKYRDYETAQWIPISWNQFSGTVRQAANAFVALGVEEQENIGIFSQNKPEWFYVDFGAFANRAVTIPFYATSSPAQAQYIINDAQIRYLFVGEQFQYDAAFSIFGFCSSLQQLIIFDRSVGVVLPGVEVKIGEDNEILLRGKTITKGYYKKAEATAAAIDPDGWFHTGDAGYFKNGQLFLTERIKDLFKTSNGKYIAPQALETKLVIDRYIDQIAIIADQRKFVSALIVPVYGYVKEYAKEKGIEYKDMAELLQHPKIVGLFRARIETLQQQFAHYEQIKRFTLLPEPFSMERGELTNTLKLKRAVVAQNYSELIEKMYEE